jgi:Cys-rich four helix bundle protein (predicted Tat secretion target)
MGYYLLWYKGKHMENVENKERRNLLKGATVAAATMALGATTVEAGEHHHHHHGTRKNQEVIDATLQCVKDGRACLDHCIILLKEGDMTMAKCTETVTEMLVMCDAMSQMATYDSKYAAQLAAICVKTCKDCEEQCAKHEKKHAACAACAKSCRACIKACKKIAA